MLRAVLGGGDLEDEGDAEQRLLSVPVGDHLWRDGVGGQLRARGPVGASLPRLSTSLSVLHLMRNVSYGITLCGVTDYNGWYRLRIKI